MGGNGIIIDLNVSGFVADAETVYSTRRRKMNALIVGRQITGRSAFA